MREFQRTEDADAEPDVAGAGGEIVVAAGEQRGAISVERERALALRGAAWRSVRRPGDVRRVRRRTALCRGASEDSTTCPVGTSRMTRLPQWRRVQSGAGSSKPGRVAPLHEPMSGRDSIDDATACSRKSGSSTLSSSTKTRRSPVDSAMPRSRARVSPDSSSRTHCARGCQERSMRAQSGSRARAVDHEELPLRSRATFARESAASTRAR